MGQGEKMDKIKIVGANKHPNQSAKGTIDLIKTHVNKRPSQSAGSAIGMIKAKT